MHKQSYLLTISFLLAFFGTRGQNSSVFSINDSLAGYDEKAVIESASYRGITKEEMNYFLYLNRRNFIKQKYNLITPPIQLHNPTEAKTAVAYCVNEDFEEASLTYPVPSTVAITTTNAVNGWATNSGSLSTAWPWTGNCTLPYCCLATPNAIRLISAPSSGYIDTYIGSSYPIYSIFGNTLNTNATSSYGFNSYGDWFVRLNDPTPNSTVNRVTKSFSVSPSNAIFNFAYLAVFQVGHECCDAPGASIILKDCSGTKLATYSVSAGIPGMTYPWMNSCSEGNSDTLINELTNDTTIVSYDTLYPTSTIGVSYTKWIKRTIDLSPWMGSCVKIEATAFDCPYVGHFGYCYFDAQCGSAVTTEINSLKDKSNIKIYPNPNSGNFNIDISKEITNAEIEIRNILGQTVHKQSVKQGKNFIRTENLAKGIYNYSVLQNKEVVSIGKIVIE